MLLSSIMKATASVGKQVIVHAPELCIAGGIVSCSVATVLAAKKGMEIKEVIDDASEECEKMDIIKEVIDSGEMVVVDDDETPYTIEKWNSDRRRIVWSTARTAVISFSPVFGLVIVGTGLILVGHRMMQCRVAALGATVIALDHNFRKYRERVIAAEGEEADFIYKTGAEYKKVEREVVNEETGEVKKKKVKELVLNEDTVTPVDYAVNYLREATWLSEYQDMSKIVKDILMIQDSANMLLKHRWFITWNEVRQMLHLKPTTAGQFVGWTMDPKSGDCVIDLRPRVVFDEKLGHDTVVLDPNLDGLMANRIDEILEKRKVGIEL